MLVESLKNIEDGKKKFINQEHSQATYAKKIDKGETKINVLMDPGKTIQPDFEYLKLGPLDIPIVFIRRITNAKIFLNPTPGWPLETNIKSLKFSPRKFEINPDI